MARLRVRLMPENRVREVEVEGPVRAAELLRLLGLPVEAAVVVVNGRVVPEWEEIKPDGEVLVIRAVSGG